MNNFQLAGKWLMMCEFIGPKVNRLGEAPRLVLGWTPQLGLKKRFDVWWIFSVSRKTFKSISTQILLDSDLSIEWGGGRLCCLSYKGGEEKKLTFLLWVDVLRHVVTGRPALEEGWGSITLAAMLNRSHVLLSMLSGRSLGSCAGWQILPCEVI